MNFITKLEYDNTGLTKKELVRLVNSAIQKPENHTIVSDNDPSLVELECADEVKIISSTKIDGKILFEFDTYIDEFPISFHYMLELNLEEIKEIK